MSVANPFSITFGSRTVGGSTGFQLYGPYVIDKSYDAIRLVFDVVVVATSYSDLQEKSDTLETDFRKRLVAGDTLAIDINGSTWTYTQGETILNARASIAKSGNPETDRGYSRAYTVAIEGELPADEDAGLRDVEVHVAYAATRQRTVTMRGTYTATDAGDAVARYQDGFDAEASEYLDAIDSSATWELADENYTMDRHRDSGAPASNLCNFTRQYVELLADQSSGQRDDEEIKDHRVVFTDTSQQPGDSREGIRRLRRVIGNYDCAVDIEQTTNLQSVFSSKVRDHIKSLFQSNFQPTAFAIEDQRVSYDETNKRLSVTLQFIYQANNSESIVEVSQSVAFREARQIDYTPTHEDDEFAAEADVGWATLERVWTRTVVALGAEPPKLRIRERANVSGPVGRFVDEIGGQQGPDQDDTTKVRSEGWNVVSSTSQVTPQYLGGPDDSQILVTTLSETVVERFHSKPGNRTSVPIQRNPTTGGR